MSKTEQRQLRSSGKGRGALGDETRNFYSTLDKAGVDLDVTIIALVKPQLTLSSYEPVEVDLPQAVFTDEDIDTRIAEFADQHATYEDTADVRPIQLEDYAHVRLVISREGKVIPQLTGAHNLFQCSYSTMPKEFVDQMLGMLPGETREFDFMGPVENSVTPDEPVQYHGVVTLESLVEKKPTDICDEHFLTRAIMQNTTFVLAFGLFYRDIVCINGEDRNYVNESTKTQALFLVQSCQCGTLCCAAQHNKYDGCIGGRGTYAG